MVPLLPQQWAVLKLLATGYCTKQIAGEMHLSDKTVEYHRARLINRLRRKYPKADKLTDTALCIHYALAAKVVRNFFVDTTRPEA